MKANKPKPKFNSSSQRTLFTKEQIQSLERVYAHTKYISPFERFQLATLLGLPDARIKTWFQNRRAKDRARMQSEFWLGYAEILPAIVDMTSGQG